ncbi:hypothetical protein BGW39_002299 [Mortierella sp. 14UC]|nr:hypothetical protein BGW39_002299 [Mortierella sp. 14UC]
MSINILLKKDKLLCSPHPHLVKTDFKQLTLVNKAWNTAFQPLAPRLQVGGQQDLGALFIGILQSIPPTLEFLDLNWSIEIQDNNDFEYRDHHVTLPGWSGNGIKTLELNKALTGNQDHDSVVAAVLNGTRALEEFRIRYYGSVGSNLVSSLVVQVAHLHAIEFENDWQEDGHESLLEIKAMVLSLWVCLGLQDLTLPIGSNYGVDEAQDAETRHQQRQDVTTKAYKQLGVLKELRTLNFGLQVPRENSNQFPLDSKSKKDFDMTLVNGLDELKDLKQLWRLDVTALRHRMREKELQWIDANWPTLKDLGGIYMYEGEELSEDEDMEEGDENDIEEEGEAEDDKDEDQAEVEQDKVDRDSVTGDESDNEGSECGVEQKPAEPEGKMTRHHVAWLPSRRPSAEL